MSKRNATRKKVKKELRSTLQQKLILVLVDYKNILPEKRYKRSLKKASRLLTSDIIGAMGKGVALPAKQIAEDNLEDVED